MKTLYEQLMLRKNKIGPLLGQKQLNLLQVFLTGYVLADYLNGNVESMSFQEEFNRFAAKKLNKTPNVGWVNIINEVSLNEDKTIDEDKAIEIFYELFEKYFKENYE